MNLRSSYQTFHISLLILTGGLVVSGCSGLAYFADESLCEGPFCSEQCDLDADCPSESICEFGRCSTAGVDGDFDGFGGSGGTGGAGGNNGGDNAIVLGDGRVIQPDGGPDGDGPGGGDTVPGGDFEGDADPGGDDAPGGDLVPAGDSTIVAGDGATCTDPDQDGYCECCELGPDCDESNPAVNVLDACGCPSAFVTCYTDDSWSGGTPTDDNPGTLPAPGPSDGTVLDDHDDDGYGSVTLDDSTRSTPYAYAANHEEGTVSRVDTSAAVPYEAARFTTVLVRDDDPYKPYVADYGLSSQCQQPSRTAIDGFGNAYVANRANKHEGWPAGTCGSSSDDPKDLGSVTKLAYFDDVACAAGAVSSSCQCVDRNGDGRVQTSNDWNDDGRIELPTCSGTACANDCVEDADCEASVISTASDHFCIRENHWLEPMGKCSATAPSVAACTGANCGTSCDQNSECPASHFCVRGECSDQAPLQEFLGKDDECVLWTVRIPGNDTNATPAGNRRSKPRAMALDGTKPCSSYSPNPGPSASQPEIDAAVLKGQTSCDGQGARCDWLSGSGSHGICVPSGSPADLGTGYIWVGDHERGFTYKLDAEGNFVCPHGGGCACDGGNCNVLPAQSAKTTWAHNDICVRTARLVSNTSTVVAHDSIATTCLAQDCFFTIDSTCRVDTINTYGAVVDSGSSRPVHEQEFGYVWVSDRGGELQRIDTLDGSVSAEFDNIGGAYGISIDHKDRPWVADEGVENIPRLYRLDIDSPDFDPNDASTEPWTEVNPVAGDTWSDVSNWRGRGLTTDVYTVDVGGGVIEKRARIFAAFNDGWIGTPSYLVAFDADTGAEDLSLRKRLDRTLGNTSNQCNGPVGVGIGQGGKVWVVTQPGEAMCSFDPANPGAELVEVPIGGEPYTYSDFTGNIFNTITNDEGRYRLIFRGCPEGQVVARWHRVEWDAEIPSGADLQISVRLGNDQSDVVNESVTPIVVADPSTGSLELDAEPDPFDPRNWFRIDFVFSAGGPGIKPILHGVDVVRSCRTDGG